MARKLYALTVTRHPTGKKTVPLLCVRLRSGRKGTGKCLGSLYCYDQPSDYRKTVWELADYARDNHGIDAGAILNLGPYPVHSR